MAKDVQTRFGLTALQAEFLKLVVSGVDPGPAYMLAGYAGDKEQAVRNGATLLRHPMVLQALHLELGRQLQADAVIARRVAMKILQDDSVSEKVRSDLSVKMLRLAGHVEPRAAVADNGPVKTLSEMSTEELRARAAQLEDEIANRARPIPIGNKDDDPPHIIPSGNTRSSANAVPSAGQVIDIIE